MSFKSKEDIQKYLLRSIKCFKLTELETIINNYFDFTNIDKIFLTIKKKKIKNNISNAAEVLLHLVLVEKWTDDQMLKTAFALQLESTSLRNGRLMWTAHAMQGTSKLRITTTKQFEQLLRQGVRQLGKDATILVKEKDGVCWLLISMKNTKMLGLYERPVILGLSTDGRYFFTSKQLPEVITKVLLHSLDYSDEREVKLNCKHVPSLLKMLRNKEKREESLANRPKYTPGLQTVTSTGIDFTRMSNRIKYMKECYKDDEDIFLEHIVVKTKNSALNNPQLPIIHQMKLPSIMTITGNILKVTEELVKRGIVTCPLPEYIRDVTVIGENHLRLRSIRPD